MLLPFLQEGVLEAGCDEAGRGPLAGSVFAAAVILPPLEGTDETNSQTDEQTNKRILYERLNDSKQLTERERYELRPLIEQVATAWAVTEATAEEIDQYNILNASILAMHRALQKLTLQPQHIIVDGNRFKQYAREDGVLIPHHTVVKGDGKYLSIAAASVLAKTYRDDYMLRLAEEYPQYGWAENKGYPTRQHREAVLQYGFTPYHRKTFKVRL